MNGRLAIGPAAACAIFVAASFCHRAAADDRSANLLSSAAGAEIIQRSTERPGQAATNLIDDKGAATSWASAEAIFPQTIMFRMARNQPFNRIVVNPAGDPDPATWVKSMVVSTADPFPHMGGWNKVAAIELAPEGKRQVITFTEIRGRFLRLEINAAQSPEAGWVSIGSIELMRR